MDNETIVAETTPDMSYQPWWITLGNTIWESISSTSQYHALVITGTMQGLMADFLVGVLAIIGIVILSTPYNLGCGIALLLIVLTCKYSEAYNYSHAIFNKYPRLDALTLIAFWLAVILLTIAFLH